MCSHTVKSYSQHIIRDDFQIWSAVAVALATYATSDGGCTGCVNIVHGIYVLSEIVFLYAITLSNKNNTQNTHIDKMHDSSWNNAWCNDEVLSLFVKSVEEDLRGMERAGSVNI